MNLRKVQIITGSAIALLILVQIFTLLLAASTLKQEITELELNRYNASADELQKSIERGLRFGKPLQGFTFLKEYIDRSLHHEKRIIAISVHDIYGKALISRKQGSQGSQNVRADTFFIERHIIGYGGKLAGQLLFEIDKTDIIRTTRDFVFNTSTIALVFSILTATGILGWIVYFVYQNDDGERKTRILLLCAIPLAQVLYSGATCYLFSEKMMAMTEMKVQHIGKNLAYNLEYLQLKNIDLSKIQGIDREFSTIIDKNTDIIGIQLSLSGRLVKSVGNNSGSTTLIPIQKPWPNRVLPRQEVGTIAIFVDPSFRYSVVQHLALNLATTLVISLILLTELSRLILMQAERQRDPGYQENAVSALRFINFVFFFGFDMVLTFVPILARDLNRPDSGLSNDLASGLPVSAEMACAGLGIILVGALCERYRWKKLFTGGVIIACLGFLLAGISFSISSFILARGIAGLGFGMVIMAGQNSLMGSKNRAQGLGNMFAGVLAGSLCGSATGAMLAEHIDFLSIFFAGAFCIALTLLFLLPKAKKQGLPAPSLPVPPADTTHTEGSVRMLLKTPRFWSTFVLGALPLAVSLTGFLFYYVPLYLNSHDVMQADIGRVFMVYSLCFIYLGPPLGSYMDRHGNTPLYSTLALILAGASLFITTLLPHLAGCYIGVFFMGIAQSIGGTSILLYLLKAPDLVQCNKEKISSVFRLSERIGQIGGPLLFGLLMTSGKGSIHTMNTIAMTGATFMLMGIIFYLYTQVSADRAKQRIRS